MGKILGVFLFLKARLREPSTMASLAAIFAMLGMNVDPGLVDNALNVLTLVFGSLGFFVKDAAPLTKV